MKKWLPHLGIVLGVCVALYALFFHVGEEERVRLQLDALEDAVEVSSGGENLVIRAARVKKSFSKIFTKGVMVRMPEVAPGSAGRHALGKMVAAAPRLYQWGKLDLSALDIELDSSETQATAFGAASVSGARHDGSPAGEQRTVSLRLDKIDGDWRVVSLSVSEPGELE